jgi:methylmalonyl-CoA/ethylmalonyl-CoA epimerase
VAARREKGGLQISGKETLMTPNAKQRLAHICILVRDIDQAIEHYGNILTAACPDLLRGKATREERFAGKDRYVTAFFQAPGSGCDIQLLQPLDPESPLFKRLEKHGEGLHHIAFASSRPEDTFQQLKSNGVTLHGDSFISDADAPDTRWAWVMPQYAHGVLIEVMDEYRKTDD